jgi:hypothetical protein
MLPIQIKLRQIFMQVNNTMHALVAPILLAVKQQAEDLNEEAGRA